ncbi:thioesterase II family protein [Hamadaea tsunoensis]|uniref:thioesterase II family protein n=1 Tax=Hamadaea tsunoensis TaxID=53368 RepID=UPI0003FFC2E8|nr:alpha/beta fold hydrolase [Hamadaea tsunoensis]
MSLRDLRPAGTEPPELTLVLLHHAGGSAAGFVPFARLLPRRWRLLAVDLPGRFYAPAGQRCTDVGEAVGYLESVLRPELTTPYAILGHSLGGLLAYELTRVLERDGGGPSWLGVSGCPAPDVLSAARHRIARTVLRDAIGLDERMLATLRSDLAIVDRYAYRAGPPVRAVMTVLRGADDPLAPAVHVFPWVEQAGTAVAFHTLPGGHFALFERPAEASDRIIRDCRSTTLAMAGA